MLRISLNYYLCVILLTYGLALHPDKCKETPREKYCLIEYSVRYRWPHRVRYVYNWYMKNCFEVRWSDHCPAVPSPATSNNFPSEEECLKQCGGWA